MKRAFLMLLLLGMLFVLATGLTYPRLPVTIINQTDFIIGVDISRDSGAHWPGGGTLDPGEQITISQWIYDPSTGNPMCGMFGDSKKRYGFKAWDTSSNTIFYEFYSFNDFNRMDPKFTVYIVRSLPTGATAPQTITGAGAPALAKTALALEATTHPAAYKDLCMMCHGPGTGTLQYPLPPTWPGTPKSPGPWTVSAGSDVDHTGRASNADCVKAGCHQSRW